MKRYLLAYLSAIAVLVVAQDDSVLKDVPQDDTSETQVPADMSSIQYQGEQTE